MPRKSHTVAPGSSRPLDFKLLGAADPAAAQVLAHACPCCGGRMIIIETFDGGCHPRYRPTAMRIDTS
jgi:hypothetical protein